VLPHPTVGGQGGGEVMTRGKRRQEVYGKREKGVSKQAGFSKWQEVGE